jgi:hypothetical protein
MALPKLPKSTRINGERWRVIPRRKVVCDGVECDGVAHLGKHVIEISVESEDEYQIMSTYFHEIMHAIIDGQGINLTDTQEHGIIAGIERWLAANCDLREKPRKPKKVKL